MDRNHALGWVEARSVEAHTFGTSHALRWKETWPPVMGGRFAGAWSTSHHWKTLHSDGLCVDYCAARFTDHMSRSAEIHKQKRQALLQREGAAGSQGVVVEQATGSVTLPVHLNQNYNFTAALKFSILRSKYYKSLEHVTSFDSLVEEVYNRVQHGGLYANRARTEPSELSCLIVKLFTSSVSAQQAQKMLANFDSPYLRLTMALYIRLGVDHDDFWKWLEPQLSDYEDIFLDCEKKATAPLGKVVQELVEGNSYCGLHLPRIPMKRMKENAELIERHDYEALRARAERNEPIRDLHTPGSLVDSMYSKDRLWYEAEIIDYGDDEQVVVSYLAFDYQEQRSLAYLELREAAGNAGRSGRARTRSEDDEEERQRKKARTG